jgi:hypothetical protein
LRLRVDTVEVCGKTKCLSDGPTDLDCSRTRRTGCCDDACDSIARGFISYPAFGVARDVRACGRIESEIACHRSRDESRRSSRCHTVLDCKLGCSRSSTSRRSSAAAAGAGRSTKSSRSHRRGGCGCGH